MSETQHTDEASTEYEQIADTASQMGYDTERTDEQVTVYVHGGRLIVYQDDDGDWVVESCWDEMWVATDEDPTSTHGRSPDVDDVLVVLRDLLNQA